MTTVGYIVAAVAAVVAFVVGFPIGIQYRKKVAEKEISSAEEEATRILNEAIKSSESKKREVLLEAKEEILKSRADYEKEGKERRADLQKRERRLWVAPWGNRAARPRIIWAEGLSARGSAARTDSRAVRALLPFSGWAPWAPVPRA